MRILKILLILIIISIPSSTCGEINLTIGNSALIIEGSQAIIIQVEYEVFNVTDNGGEAFRVTDSGGQDFNVLKYDANPYYVTDNEGEVYFVTDNGGEDYNVF